MLGDRGPEQIGPMGNHGVVRNDFSNVYEDSERAGSYATLEFPGTYYLAYRDLPRIIAAYTSGTRALDFGCGAGRSTRFLGKLGFEATGIDISAEMIAKARELDPEGDYRLAVGDDMAGLHDVSFDLALSVFTFDNVPMQEKPSLFRALRRLLRPSGRLVSLVSTPEIYMHEWASFSTKDFPVNHTAKSGEKVFTVMLDVDDRRPVTDVLCTHEDYEDIYLEAGLRIIDTVKPLGRPEEPYAWVNETKVAPWAIYVLASMQL